MYSKTEITQLRQAFWTTFGQYMQPVPSADGGPINWINYKTGLKHVYFRLQADNRHATIGIELTHPDAGLRELFFEQFREVRLLLLGNDQFAAARQRLLAASSTPLPSSSLP